MKNLVFISEDAVKAGHPNGGQICIRRHFARLANGGWDIHVVAPAGHEAGLPLMNAKTGAFLPRIWVDRFRTAGPVQWLASLVLVIKTAIFVKRTRADVLITNLNRTFPVLAARVARLLKVPLGVIVYDHRETWEKDQDKRQALYDQTRLVFDTAMRIWFVSPELRGAYLRAEALAWMERAAVLPPIPEGWQGQLPKWLSSYGKKCVLGFAGGLHTVEQKLLANLTEAVDRGGHELVMILPPGREHELGPLKECKGLRCVPAFPEVCDALAFLQSNCTALFVPYSLEPGEVSTASTSFPSKLLEYCHLGLPVIVMASSRTPVGRWAQNVALPTYVSGVEGNNLGAVLGHLTREEYWEQCSRQIRQFSLGEFSPEAIHAAFESDLDGMIRHETGNVASK